MTSWLHPPENGAQWAALVWLVCMLVGLVWATLTYARMRRLHDGLLKRDPVVGEHTCFDGGHWPCAACATAEQAISPMPDGKTPTPVLAVRCPACDAAPGVECITVNDWGCHLQRYQAAGGR